MLYIINLGLSLATPLLIDFLLIVFLHEGGYIKGTYSHIHYTSNFFFFKFLIILNTFFVIKESRNIGKLWAS